MVSLDAETGYWRYEKDWQRQILEPSDSASSLNGRQGRPSEINSKKSRKTDGVVSIADDNEKFETDSESVNCAETNPDSSADEETLLLKSVSTRIAGGLLGVKRISLLKTESGRVPDRFLIWYDSYSVRSS